MTSGRPARFATRPSPLHLAYDRFHRAVAIYCLIVGIVYWVRLLGVYDGALWRVDLMPLHWQVAGIALSVVFPIAAVGLWLLAPWGPVIWFLGAAGEGIMYGALPELFGHRPVILLVHVLVALAYAAFRLAIYWRRRRANAQGASRVE